MLGAFRSCSNASELWITPNKSTRYSQLVPFSLTGKGLYREGCKRSGGLWHAGVIAGSLAITDLGVPARLPTRREESLPIKIAENAAFRNRWTGANVDKTPLNSFPGG